MRLPFAHLFRTNWKDREKRALRKASRQIDRALNARMKHDQSSSGANGASEYPPQLRGK